MKKMFIAIFTLLMLMAASCWAAKPILILGIREIETTDMKGILENPKKKVVAGHDCVIGKLNGRTIILMQSRLGMVNAASATTIAMERFKPGIVLNVGVANAQRKELKVNTVVLGEKVCYHNSFSTEYRAVGEGVDQASWNYEDTEVFYNGDWAPVRYLHGDRNLLMKAANTPYKGGMLIKGIIASGDVWNRQCDELILIRKEFNSDCEDMESFAVATVCTKYNVPFLNIRAICNNEFWENSSDMETATSDYFNEAVYNVQEYMFKLLNKLVIE